jgi:transcriptional regulator with XRE-family HTH domain
MTDYKGRRLELGLTRAQVAEMTGMSEKNIAYIENGAHSPRLEQWYNLLSVLFDGNDGTTCFKWNPNVLWEARSASGMSMEAFAKKIGVSKRIVVKWECPRGNTVPTVENLSKICQAFNMMPKDFLNKVSKYDEFCVA